MRITIIAAGKIREKYLKDAISEYEKRLSKYAKVEIIEVADEKCPEELKGKALDQVRLKEGERMLQRLPQGFVITLDIDGEGLSSEGLAGFIEDKAVRGESSLIFVIGGSSGLGENIREKSNYSLSFSKLTFPHQLMRVMLLEQIYRAFKIINHEPYHK